MTRYPPIFTAASGLSITFAPPPWSAQQGEYVLAEPVNVPKMRTLLEVAQVEVRWDRKAQRSNCFRAEQ